MPLLEVATTTLADLTTTQLLLLIYSFKFTQLLAIQAPSELVSSWNHEL